MSFDIMQKTLKNRTSSSYRKHAARVKPSCKASQEITLLLKPCTHGGIGGVLRTPTGALINLRPHATHSFATRDVSRGSQPKPHSRATQSSLTHFWPEWPSTSESSLTATMRLAPSVNPLSRLERHKKSTLQ